MTSKSGKHSTSEISPVLISRDACYMLIKIFFVKRLKNTHNDVASEEIPLSLTEAERMLKEHEDIKVSWC